MLSQSSQQKTQLVAVGGFGQVITHLLIVSHYMTKVNPKR